ncbi:polysaccharide pyruvyl transferase family protein [Microbacterium sp. A196]|uniref:polysaccharide pyruvyl transferase family protein n=1 Tax=Microbacterium sp. A196 TaxID=3457320 RepID=UPI003FD1B328
MSNRPFKPFVTLTGEYQNVGDGVIRRIALDWVRVPDSDIVAYTGGAPDDWIDQMALSPSDTVIRGGVRGFFPWIWRMVTCKARPVLLTEPGEMTLARYNMPRQLGILVAVLVTRAKRGIVVLPPRAVTRRTEALPWVPTVRVHRAISRLATFSLWRDEWSLARIGSGEIVPDTAFGAEIRHAIPPTERDILFVSMRGARPLPSNEWFNALRETAGVYGLDIIVAAQVEEDDSRAEEIALRLDANFLPWDRSGIAREQQLREVYDRTRVAVADRLHVLILAAMSGAVPLEMVDAPTTKISSHFATIGVQSISFDTHGKRAREMCTWLAEQYDRADEVQARIVNARGTITDLQQRIAQELKL